MDAQLAFLDPARVIARDLLHSGDEPRLYCFGEVAGGILTVRVTIRADVIRIIGAGFWRRGRKIYDSQNKDRDEPLGRLEVVSDFLPPPEKLVLRDDGVKITISLSKRSVEFFKRHAARSRVPYQKMIRSLLDGYAKHHDSKLKPTAQRAVRGLLVFRRSEPVIEMEQQRRLAHSLAAPLRP